MVSEETASLFFFFPPFFSLLHGGDADVGALSLSLSLSLLEFTSSGLGEAGCFSPLTAATSFSGGLIHECGSLPCVDSPVPPVGGAAGV